MAEEVITEEVSITTPALPRTGEGMRDATPVDAVTGRPKSETTLRANVTDEYVSGSALNVSSGFAENLPPYIDSISSEFGADIYERMYSDAHVAGQVNALLLAATTGGWQLTPAKDYEGGEGPDAPEGEEDPEIEEAHEIREFCHDNLCRIDLPALLYDMARACYLGHRVAEVVYDEKYVPGQLWLGRVKVKERYAYSFVVDNRKNIVGILGNLAGRLTTQLVAPSLVDIENQGNLLPREKFAIFTFRPSESDPRGTSILRPCYNAWWLKMQTLAEYHKFLIIYASPSLVGILPENAQPGKDPVTQAIVSAEDAMSDALAGLKNNTAVVVGHGGDVKPIFLNTTTGEAFLNAFEYYDKQITTAITSQALALADASHQTKAATGEQKNVLDMVVEALEAGLCRMVERDILHPLIKYNFGEDACKYCPTLSLSAAEEADITPLAEAFSKLKAAAILQSAHMPEVWAKLGLSVVEMDPEPEPMLPGDPNNPDAPPTAPGVKKKPGSASSRASMSRALSVAPLSLRRRTRH